MLLDECSKIRDFTPTEKHWLNEKNLILWAFLLLNNYTWCELLLKSWRVCHSILGVFSVQIINTNSSFVIRSKAVWCFSYQLFDHSNSLHTDFEYGLLSSRTDSRWVWPISKGCMHTLTLLNPPLMCPWVSVCPILNFVFSWSSPFH